MTFLNKITRVVFITIAVLLGLYFAAALAMIFWPQPTFASIPERLAGNQDSTVTTQNETAAYQEHRFTMRDGAELFAQHFPATSDVLLSDMTVLLIHGVATDGLELNKSAAMIQQATGAAVYAIDLRGHGQSDGQPGDVDYIGQYEDDVADAIAAIHTQQPDGHLILAGHSMGGGIALRYGMLDDTLPVDGYLLFAPHLGTNSPTLPTATANEGNTDVGENNEPFIKLHIPRIIGLSMLNVVGITPLNGLSTMFFNLPDWRTNTYSYRAMVNSSPADYRAALTAVDAPMLVLVGSDDEAFIAEEFAPAVGEYSSGEVQIIAGETHNGIYQNKEAVAAVQTWLTSGKMAFTARVQE